jgi:hypothetical protein
VSIAVPKPFERVEKAKTCLGETQIETYSELKQSQTVLDIAQIDIFGTTITGIRAFFNRLIPF